MTDNIKNWYLKNHPDSLTGEKINSEITFNELINNLPKIYKLLGVVDYPMRNEIFYELARRNNCTYNDIYFRWLGHKGLLKEGG